MHRLLRCKYLQGGHLYDQLSWLITISFALNPKTGMQKHGKDEVVLNKLYQKLAECYGTANLPARVRAPKEKPLLKVASSKMRPSAHRSVESPLKSSRQRAGFLLLENHVKIPQGPASTAIMGIQQNISIPGWRLAAPLAFELLRPLAHNMHAEPTMRGLYVQSFPWRI